MRARTIAFLGNCQAQALATVYDGFFGRPNGDVVTFVSSHVEIPPEGVAALRQAEIVVAQKFDFESPISSSGAAPGARRVWFPALSGAFLWPYGRKPHPRNSGLPYLPEGPYGAQLGDAYLNKALHDKVPRDEAVQAYLDLDIAQVAHVDRLFELHMTKQGERDGVAGIDVAGFVKARLRSEQLFKTPDHPSLALFRHYAAQVFARLDLPADKIAWAMDSLTEAPFPQSELPLHPRMVAHLGIAYLGGPPRYRFLFEGGYTFEEYARRYYDYAWNEALQEGVVALNTAGPEPALPLLNQGLAGSPDSLQGLCSKAYALRALGRVPDAVGVAQLAMAKHPAAAHAYISASGMALTQGDAAAAKRLADKAVELSPVLQDAHLAVAEAALAAGQSGPAAEAALRSVQLCPGAADETFRAGNVLRRCGRHADALRLMRDAARFAPDTLSYRRAYLDLLVRHGGKEEVRAALTAATPLAMDDVVWRVALAQHWSRLGDDAIAESVLQLALERAPDSTLCRTNLAAVRRRRAMTGPMTGPMTRPMTRPGAPQAGDTAASPVADESAADPQGALRAELSRLAQQLSASGDAAGAGAFLEVASDQRTTEAELRRSTMELLEKTGEFTRAAEEAALLLKHAPLDASVHLSLGRCLLRAGQPGPAEQALRRSLRLSPADDAAGHLLAACLEQTGRNDEARAVLEAAINQQPDNPHRVARYGHHLTSRGDLGAAETAFRRAVSLSPKEASLHLALADLLARRHDWAEAVKEAREATTLDPDHGTAQSLFGRLLDIEVQRLAREAEGAMRRALALQPDDMECVIQLADLLHRSSRMDEAAGLVRSALVRTPADARLLAKMEQLSAASGLPDADRAEAGAAEAAMEVRAQATEDTGDPVPAQALAEPSATDGLPKTGRVPGAGLLRRILQG